MPGFIRFVFCTASIVAVGPLLAARPAPRPFDVTVTGTGAGRPILLIPGLATPGDVWDSTVAHLKWRHELHVLTLAGFGGPPAVGEPFLPRVADGVIDYLARTRLVSPVIVGHSLGGFLAFQIASRAPGAVAGIVAVDGVPFLPGLANPAATASASSASAEAVRKMYASLSREQFLAQTRMALTAMISAPADVERALVWSARTDPSAAGVAVAEMLTTDLRDGLAAMTSPALLIGALGSAPEPMRAVLRESYRAQIARAPRAEVIFAERARHFVMLDDLPFLVEAIDTFVASLPAWGER